MDPPEGESLETDSVFQNRLNSVKKIIKFDLNSKETVPILGVTPWDKVLCPDEPYPTTP